jgi:hypothetical protein
MAFGQLFFLLALFVACVVEAYSQLVIGATTSLLARDMMFVVKPFVGLSHSPNVIILFI